MMIWVLRKTGFPLQYTLVCSSSLGRMGGQFQHLVLVTSTGQSGLDITHYTLIRLIALFATFSFFIFLSSTSHSIEFI